MPLKKYINGSWVDTSYKRYETGTDVVTNLPVEIFTDGQPVSSYTLKGNTSVSGTPSPQNPITISGVGDKTANLFDKNRTEGIINNAYINQSGEQVTSQNYYLSYPLEVLENSVYTWSFVTGTDAYHTAPTVAFYDENDQLLSVATHNSNIKHFTFTTPLNTKYIRGSVFIGLGQNTTMFLEGSTEISDRISMDYIPYGYKISILKDLQALTPIYLNEPLMGIATADTIVSSGTVTRAYQIVELNSSMYIEAYNATWGTAFTISISNVSSGGEYAAIDAVCSHYPKTTRNNLYRNNVNGICYSGSTNAIIINDVDCATVQDFKNFITAQKEANTPITIVIAVTTPTTESVTVPTITTTGGTVTLDVDTTVKPSELDLTYHGWHEHEPLKRENGQWV